MGKEETRCLQLKVKKKVPFIPGAASSGVSLALSSAFTLPLEKVWMDQIHSFPKTPFLSLGPHEVEAKSPTLDTYIMGRSPTPMAGV